MLLLFVKGSPLPQYTSLLWNLHLLPDDGNSARPERVVVSKSVYSGFSLPFLQLLIIFAQDTLLKVLCNIMFV